MHRIGFIVPPGFQVMGLAPLAAFEMADLQPGDNHYDVHLLSERGGPVRSSCGFAVETEPFGDAAFDTLIAGAISPLDMTPSPPGAVAFVREAAKTTRRIASICTGAFLLAEAGLLAGRRATTHWFHADSFKTRFPDVRMEEDRIYINDGPIWTSAGMTAGTDLAVALIDKDLGPQAAKEVAKLLVMNQRRLGGQKQHSALLDLAPKSDRIEVVLAHIRQNLRSTLSVEELAAVARLSPRQFSRAFLAETGHSPARAVEQLRLEAARFMIEEGRHPVNVVAQETGFADRERMRRAFVRTFGLPPQALRRSARLEAIGVH
jgi:transcriptional regulator GlxA family with amidase domain